MGPRCAALAQNGNKNLQQCANKLTFNPKEPLLPHSIPSHPWQKIGTGILTWDSKDYLIIVNYFSQFLEIDLLTHQDIISCY